MLSLYGMLIRNLFFNTFVIINKSHSDNLIRSNLNTQLINWYFKLIQFKCIWRWLNLSSAKSWTKQELIFKEEHYVIILNSQWQLWNDFICWWSMMLFVRWVIEWIKHLTNGLLSHRQLWVGNLEVADSLNALHFILPTLSTRFHFISFASSTSIALGINVS